MKAYQLKIGLKEMHPPVWRRCIIPAGYTFSQLTIILNSIMGWEGYHLSGYTFRKLGLEFQEDPEEDFFWDTEVLDSREYIIDEYLDQVNKFIYTYDFGDNWEHEVTVEQVLEDYDRNYPEVIKYKGRTPLEDCGGPWGYQDLKKILSDPEDEEYEDMMEWSGGEPDYPFDLEETNEELSGMYLSDLTSEPMSQDEIWETYLHEDGFRKIIVPDHPASEEVEDFLDKDTPLLSRLMEDILGKHLDNIIIEPEDAIKELTVILLYLTRMRESNRGITADRSWKTYPFSALDELEEKGYITNSHKAKSVYITDEGLEYARKMLLKYGIKDWEE